MGYSIDTTKYLHTYEAYRIPEGSSALNAENSNLFLQKSQENS